jgi:ferredoxin
VLIEAGKDPVHDCKRGDCGICQVAVIDGIPDHRDFSCRMPRRPPHGFQRHAQIL